MNKPFKRLVALGPRWPANVGAENREVAGLRSGPRSPDRELARAGPPGSVPGAAARRGFIPKADGSQRPLAIAALEDKIVQRATAAVADKGYDANIIAICAASSVSRPRSTSEASRPAQGWASGAGPLNAATRGCWRTSVSPCATTGLASSSCHCCRAHASSWLQNASLANSENRL